MRNISIRHLLLAGLAAMPALAGAAPTLFIDTINGSSQIAGIDDLAIGSMLYDVRWNSTLNYYDTFSYSNPLSPTFMNDAAGGNEAALAIADFINSVPAIPSAIGFQSMQPNDGTSNVLPARAIGMIPTSYSYNSLYSRWESNGAALQFDAIAAYDASGAIDPAGYRLSAATGGFGAILDENGPGGRGVIGANQGWSFVSFTAVGSVTPPLPAVPEPDAFVLGAAGLAAVAFARRRARAG